MIAVIGQTGQLGQALAALPNTHVLGRNRVDLCDPEPGIALLKSLRPTAVINAAAYTAVDRAEEEEELATQVNGHAVGALARACAEMVIPFVTVSTDYVFDGSGAQPWRPDDPIAPLNAYGRSKALGEDLTRAAGGTVLRTSWVVSGTGSNFVATMLRLGATREVLTVVADQIGAPTPATALAAACHRMAEQLSTQPAKAGVYHLQGAPLGSWADVARAIFAEAGLACQVKDIPTSDYPTPAKRPLNSRLDCESLKTVFGISQPDWRVDLAPMITALQARG